MNFTERFNLAMGRNERWGVENKEQYFKRNAPRYLSIEELRKLGYKIKGKRA